MEDSARISIDRDTAPPSQKKKSDKLKKPRVEVLVREMGKKNLLDALNWEHPSTTLNIGTLSVNDNRALVNEPDLVPEVLRCLKESVRLAADIKRSCQQLIGRFIECIVAQGTVDESDRISLDHICPRISAKIEVIGEQDDDEDGEEDVDGLGSSNKQENFLAILLRHLYSGNYPLGKTTTGKYMQKFIDRLGSLSFLEKTSRADIRAMMPYTPTILTRLIASQPSVELKRTY
ncbi:hypothetical protein BGZ51_009709 [Haplosporangium sp. Z 767]|nr:hypothetical protein BGZ51_009709 [Haplosporangium sp. Z 767]KAF9194073.1 hypothetical protein BGZ50_006738 [Haplosporangium sp. Z 11]